MTQYGDISLTTSFKDRYMKIVVSIRKDGKWAPHKVIKIYLDTNDVFVFNTTQSENDDKSA